MSVIRILDLQIGQTFSFYEFGPFYRVIETHVKLRVTVLHNVYHKIANGAYTHFEFGPKSQKLVYLHS